ncbi:MAG TPA: pilus assembly protein TadG-related protein [Anaerolineales bacterium]|nr:pilus assembly protein TadG-related protein [Anaerolineales bacterium]
MQKSSLSTPRGQALVLIALAAIALFALAALAIDGSAVFSDRRHSQNASDTSALAAALAIARGKSTVEWKLIGEQRAASNGYDASNGITEVYVHLCSDHSVVSGEGITLTCQGLPTGAKEDEYVHVYIKSVVKLNFARIIGWKQVINHTDAVARATPPKVVPWYKGNAIVSTMLTCKNEAGWPHDPFTVTGHSGTTVVSSGIFVNADCPNSYDQGGSSQVKTDKGVCVVDSAQYTNTVPIPTTGCDQIDPNQYTLLTTPTCSTKGDIQEVSSKNYVASPGYYDKPFPDKSPSGALKLQRGIYCFNDGISINSGWDITTDLNGDGPSSDEGVFFYVPSGAVTFNGGSHINIQAINTPYAGFDSTYLNYLIYLPPTNTSTVTITGSNGSSFTGTILAPASHIKLSGGNTTSGGVDDGQVTIDAQIIGFTTEIAGNGTLDIIYTQSKNGVTTTKPSLSQTE